MSNISVSIIVPVYKAEAYLHRCLDSILAQTFTNWELLLIDDGSPDRSGVICDEYASKDARIRVFHKENGGVSSARQKGQDEAQGEYTIHADPDDWVEPTMLEELYKKAKADDADMVICDYYMNDGKNQTYITQKPTVLDRKTVLGELLFQQLHGSCWNKLVRRACYSGYGICFPNNMNCWEDLYFNVKLLTNEGVKVGYLAKAFYHYDYTENPNSLVRKPNIRTVLSQKFFIDDLCSDLVTEFGEAFYKMKVQTKELAWRVGTMDESEFKALFSEITNRYKSDYKHSRNISKRLILLSFTHYNIAKRLYGLLLSVKNFKTMLYGR